MLKKLKTFQINIHYKVLIGSTRLIFLNKNINEMYLFQVLKNN